MTFTAKGALKYLGYSARVRNYVLNLYNEPHRKYHNETHIDEMLRWVNPEYKKLVPLLEAILFHDVVYDDKAVAFGFNEAASLAVYSLCRLDREPEDGDFLAVVQAINATAYHTVDQPHLSDLSQLVLDLDLQSFAQPQEEFLAGCLKVKAEWLQTVSEGAFLTGSKKFLQTLLKRRRLYYTLNAWEEPARANLKWRIETM